MKDESAPATNFLKSVGVQHPNSNLLKEFKSDSLTAASTQSKLEEQKSELRKRILTKFRAGLSKTNERVNDEETGQKSGRIQTQVTNGKSKARELMDKGMQSSQEMNSPSEVSSDSSESSSSQTSKTDSQIYSQKANQVKNEQKETLV